MKKHVNLLVILFFGSICFAQTDEIRQATGLPVKIGETYISKDTVPLSGKIMVHGFPPSQPRPTLFVAVYLGSSLIERRQVDETGNYLVPRVPREGAVLKVEDISGTEITSHSLPSTTTVLLRQDVSISWAQFQKLKSKTGVISAKTFYQRSDRNQRLFEEAMTAIDEKKLNDALLLLNQLLKHDPNDFIAWTELGTLFFKDKNYSDAEIAYQKALELKPDLTVASLNMGKLYLAQTEGEKAVLVLTKAVEEEPASAEANHYLGEAYLQIKKGSKAVVYLNEAIKLAPLEKAEIHLRLAALYNAAGLKDKAVAEYQLFLGKVPDYEKKGDIEKYIKENSPK